MPSRSRSRTRSRSHSRTRSKSRSPPGPKEPLTKDEFQERLGDNYDFALDVNKSLLKHFSHYFKKVTNDDKNEYKKTYGSMEGMITDEELKSIRAKFNHNHKVVAISTYKNIEKAPYNWQKLVIEVTKLVEDFKEPPLSFDRYVWDAGLLVLFAAYPKWLKSGIFQGHIKYKQFKPMF